MRCLQELCKQGILDSKTITSSDFCESRVLGKTHKLKFANASYISNCILENQTSKKLKKLRTDNGLEFCNKEFNDFCIKHGIATHRTCTETPLQNGLVERMNRIILDKVKCMLSESGLSKHFWAEATNTTVYLINRSPCSAINFQTLMHAWTGKKTNLSHLKPFGCIEYIHVNQGKLNPRAIKGIFIGYPNGVKGYKIWLVEEKKCVISRNVIFHENALFKTNLQELQVPPKFEKFQLDVQNHSDHTSQGSLDETSDQNENVQTTPQSSKTTGFETHTDEESTLRAIDRLFTTSQDQVLDAETTQETSDQGGVLSSYQLTWDRSRRAIRTPVRYAQANLIAYALTIGEEIQLEDPVTF